MSSPPNNLTHPVLPPSICRAIIKQCLTDPITLPPSAQNIRLLLMLVSREWRDIVLSPIFWDRIAFLPGPFNTVGRQLEMLKALVKRSISKPLSFYFIPQLKKDPVSLVGLPDEDLFYTGGTIDFVKEIILPHASRLQYLQLILPHTQLIRTLREIPEGALEALETVDIACTISYICPHAVTDVRERYKFHPLKSLLRLQELSFSTSRGVNPLDLWVPWPHMKKLDLGNTALPPDIFNGIMRQTCRSLVEGVFSVMFDLHSCYVEHLYGPKVKMAALQQLHIRFLDLSYHPTFPLLFTLPVIQELWVERADRIITFDWNIYLFTAWLSDSSRSLERLILINFPFHRPAIAHHERNTRRRTSCTELEDLFKVVPNLKGLGLPIGVRVHSETLGKIAQGVLLPHCHTLELSTDVDPTIVLTMVAMRNIPPPPPDILTASRLTALTLNFPITYRDRTMVLDQVMRSLNISQGYVLRFIPPCNECRGHCCFGL